MEKVLLIIALFGLLCVIFEYKRELFGSPMLSTFMLLFGGLMMYEVFKRIYSKKALKMELIYEVAKNAILILVFHMIVEQLLDQYEEMTHFTKSVLISSLIALGYNYFL